jgi:hypothetical protein
MTGAIAPIAEQLICTQKVAGANPAGSILKLTYKYTFKFFITINMKETRLELENTVLNDIFAPAIQGLLVTGCKNSDETLHFTAYRQTTLELATYLKLSGLFKINTPIDCHVVDRIEDKYRFTVIYNMQSGPGNVRVQLITKTNDVLPLISLQSVYPAFN